MKKQPLVKKLYKPVSPIISITAIAGVVLLIAAYPYIMRALSRNNVSSSVPPKITYLSPTITPTATVSLQPTITLNTYTSKALGISFSYPVVSWNITPHEVGSQIFFGSDTGQFIQVFHLPHAASSIETAVRNTILEGYSQQDCSVVSEDSAKRGFASNIELGYITFPGNTGSDVYQAGEDKCPKGYVNKGGLFYFIMDKNHPTTLLFISESQQPLAGVGTTITSSIKVLN
jgi:hypothetical protein